MLLDDLADYLSSAGVTAAIYGGFMPEAPDAAVAIYETGGAGPVHGMAPGPGQAKLEQPRVQVVVRGAQYDYAAARLVADQIWKLLDQLPERTINGTRYCWGEAVQSPMGYARDEDRRAYVACNFDIVKELS